MAHNVLERYPDARLRVYVVWVKRWGTDTRGEIDGAGLVDQRVTHLWDTAGVIGQPFLSGSAWTWQPGLRLLPAVRS